MGYPKKLYKSLNERIRVHNEDEEQAYKSEGWVDVHQILQNGQFINLQQTDLTIADKIKANKAKEADIEAKMQELKSESVLLESNLTPEDAYITQTGGRPIRNGQPTNRFIAWKEKNGYS